MDVSNSTIDKGFHLYFDNYFSSPSLLSDLLVRDTYCMSKYTGSISLSLIKEMLVIWKGTITCCV